MMILRGAGPSPFVRKVRIAASLLGLADKIEVTPADTTNPSDALRQQNPVGKIPVLITEDKTTIYDSPVIVEYLDHLAGGGRVIPRDPMARIAALKLQALCDGILDASLLLVYEGRYRSAEQRVQNWVDMQADKVARCLTVLDNDPPPLDPVHVGQITLACALGYQDLRFEGAWRKKYPRLVAWLDDFAKRVPAFAETKVT